MVNIFQKNVVVWNIKIFTNVAIKKIYIDKNNNKINVIKNNLLLTTIYNKTNFIFY